MATKTVYPYGTNGSLPHGAAVINDLKHNDATKALSAAQGKRIGDYIFGETEDADLSQLTTYGGYIRGDNGKWNNTSPYQFVLLPVAPGDIYIIRATSATSANIALLTSDAHVDGTDASFAAGHSGTKVIAAGESLSLTIPSDALYMYILVTGSSSVDKTPLSIEKILSASLMENIESMLDGITDVVELVDTTSVQLVTAYIRGISSDQYSNKWLTGNSSYKCKLIPVTPGDIYILKASIAGSFNFAVLTDNEPTNGAVPNYANGFEQAASVDAGAKAMVEIPSNGAYLYFSCIVNGTNREPSVYVPMQSPTRESIETILETEVKDNLFAKREITVAAADAPAWQKKMADFQCTGTNDEVTIQKAIDYLATTGGRIRLTTGIFSIDSFPKSRTSDYPNVALLLPQGNSVDYVIEGDTFHLNNEKGTVLRVSDTCYEGLSSNTKYCIIGATGTAQNGSHLSLHLSNISLKIPWNQKKVMGLDLFAVSRFLVERVVMHSWRNGYNGNTVDLSHPCAAPIDGSIGIRSCGGSNWGTAADFRNVAVSGFYEGYALAGEHIVGINMSAIMCHYGYTFGNFTYTGASEHDMTLINCCEERCMCGPYFADCSGNQCITMISFNSEVGSAYIPGGERIQGATEQTQGKFRGRVDYTIMDASWRNVVGKRFWEPGHGHGFISRNMAHLPACDTTTRNSYAPAYLERIFDTTLGKEVICTNEETKEWRDAMGNIV